MPGKAISVVVLVCPQCGKKYKGDASKPDARYQCPVDQSTLIRLDLEAAAAIKQAKTEVQQDNLKANANVDGASPSRDGASAQPGPAVKSGPSPDAASAFSSAGAATAQMPDFAAPPPSAGYSTPYAPPPDIGYSPDISHSEDENGAPAPPEPPPTYASSPAPPAYTPPPQPPPPQASVVAESRPAPPRVGAGPNILSSFDQRRSVVATLEKLGGTDPSTGQRIPVYKYETKSKLGAGGMGEVYKVLDRDLRREVAMKMLRPAMGADVDETDLLRFIKEAQATGRLEHPNIVPVHDLGVDGEGRIYFTLKYVKGVSLKEVIRGRRDATALEDKRKFRDVFSSRQMLEILTAVCNAVAYAHSKDIIHRDLKPDNVMLGKFGEVLVMDWGLAKILRTKSAEAAPSQEAFLDLNLRANLESNVTMEGAIAGTPAYMSPEQATGKISELDEHTDIYSLGAILFEIIAGDPPYKGTTALEVVRMVAEGPPSQLSSGTYGFRPIPRELKAICEKAMAREPRQRYNTAEELRNDIQAYLDDQPVSCCPDSPVQKTVKWVKRNRQRVTMATTSLIGILLVVFLCWAGWRQYNVYRLLSKAEAQVAAGRKVFLAYKSSLNKQQASDPYQVSLQASAQGELFSLFRTKLNSGIDSARKALDLSPENKRARQFLAESYMELWRLALAENNDDLMKAYSAEVLRYAPDPADFQHELEGLGSLQLTIDPANADVYLFKYETMNATDRQGNLMASRLIPVPYNPEKRESDSDFLEVETQRASSGAPIAANSRGIFRLDPTPESKLGSGSVSLKGLDPGSYLLVMLTPNGSEVHIPFVMDRMGKLSRSLAMPKLHDLPDGFVYVDGGPAWIGGGSANALPRQQFTTAPFVLQQEEVTMADYAAFLKAIGGEAKNRMPRDSGKLLATLSADGLAPADGSDPAKFARSPVRGVSYNDALAYAAWRTQHDGITYRLPTEQEWESACRGADSRKYAWGNFPGQGLAILLSSSGQLPASASWRWQDYKDESPWGIRNLAGGVAEWTGSTYAQNPSETGYGQHTVKGNAWSLPPTGLECGFRASGADDYTHPTIGFRLAADWPLKRIATAQTEQPNPPAVPPIATPEAATAPKPKQTQGKKMTHSEEVIHKLGLDR